MMSTPWEEARAAELQQQAVTLFKAGRLGEARNACRQLLDVQPDRPDLLGFAGMIALKLGDHEDAAKLYRAAVARKPEFAEAHYNLGNALKSLGRLEEAAAAYRRALDVRPDLAPAYHNLGNALQGLEQFEEAAAAYRKVLELAPDVAEPARNLGIVLEKLGQLDEADAAYRRALALSPDWPLLYSNLITISMKRGAPRAAIEFCDAWLRLEPDSIEALAHRALALIEDDDRETARELLDFDRFVWATRVAVPPDYDDLASFNHALAEHVLAHPSLKVPPEDDPTYHHPQLQITGELLSEPKGPIADLEALIRDAVEGYRKRVMAAPDHPFVESWPERWRLSVWSVVLNGQGNLVPHVHLDGYLGGVYYAALPDVVGESREEAGWFELGRPPPELCCRSEPELKRFKPEEGRMLLFPSYFYHGTVPFEAPQKRISIAFDVVPEN